MAVIVRPSGPIPAKVMIVGEAPGRDEEVRGEPFVGYSGKELDKILHECGLSRSQCFVTNVARERPYNNDIANFIAVRKKDRTAEHTLLRDKYVKRPVHEGFAMLRKEIEMVKPNIIIALGNTALWALTGHWGILKWRGSMLYTDDFTGANIKVIPTIHPAAIMRDWSLRTLAVNDIRRAARFVNGEPYPKPEWKFIVRPSFSTTIQVLQELKAKLDAAVEPVKLSFDIETRSGHIACAGISWSYLDGICVPLMCVENNEGYWREDEEAAIVWLLFKILTHPKAWVGGQNIIYDSQYTYRHWCFVPNVKQDSMITWHTAFVGQRKGLDYQASLMCDYYRYWKDDSKDWDPKMGEDQLWIYNLEDCVRTQECMDVGLETINKFHLQEQHDFQQAMFWPVLQAMQRGVRIDTKIREKFALDLIEEQAKREQYLIDVLGHPLNPRSPDQLKKLLYEDLQLPVQKDRKTGQPTTKDEALDKLASKEPLLKPILKRVAEYRSLGVFLSTFVQAPLDHDGRMRCSYNICGTETLRLASSKNAFDSGTNLQNVPKGTEAKEPEDLELPNIRRMFVPDPGYTFFDMDLDRADLQVVVWEADDKDLKEALRLGVDMHCLNAVDMYNIKGIPVDELIETHPNYKEHRARIGGRRQIMKTWVHGTDYGGSPRTMAINCGLLVRDAERMQTRWFEIHPGIKRWHTRTESQLRTQRFVSNAYGYRRYYFDRVDDLLPEALAWIPQSTVAITINRAWLNIYRTLPEVQVLLQVHDSLAGQYPTSSAAQLLPRLREASLITIPYPDPLIIPTGIKTSTVSWGDCK